MFKILVRWFHKLLSRQQIVGSDLSRYLTSSNHFSLEKRLVKSNAFIPRANPENGRWETSVFRISGLSDEEIWEIGVSVVTISGKTLYGRAAIRAEDVEKAGLLVIPDDNPLRHANIIGWPDEKSERKLFAERLVGSAQLILRQQAA